MVFPKEETLAAMKELSDLSAPQEAVGKYRAKVEKVLSELLESKGVKLAMASTFLHFFNPTVFPILDQRAYRVIFKRDYTASTSVPISVRTYFEYVEGCIRYHSEVLRGKIPFSRIDQYLYQLDKEIGNGVKMN